MRAEIVSIGTELLLGEIVNGNAAWLGSELAQIGVDVDRTVAVGDNIGRIVAALGEAAARADVVIATGGLGPTQDDLTREALAELTGVAIQRDPALEAELRDRYAARGRPDFPPNNLRMADVPVGAAVLSNRAGTAPGLGVATSSGARIFALPGVPAEMREIFREWLRPELVELVGPGTILLSRELRTVGAWESEISHALADLDSELSAVGNPTLAYLAAEGQTLVRVSAKAADAASAERAIDAVETRVRAVLGDVIYGSDADTLESVVVSLLRSGGATVATAESLTGGLLGGALTSVPGSSESYLGGVVAYATRAKADLLGVSSALLAERGAVDPDVAIAMATGVRERFGATYGLSTTGVAGPTAQDGVAAGTVFLGLAGPGVRFSVPLTLPGDRVAVRRSSVLRALDTLRRELLGLPCIQR
jgi:nicotinamide-nucleotide amidase